MTAIIAGIKGISTLEVAAVNHFIDILNNGITNFNYNKINKKKTYLSRMRGRGVDVRVNALFYVVYIILG